VVVQASLIVIGSLSIRIAYEFTQSASGASVVGFVFLLAIIGLQRRQGASRPEHALASWEDVPSSAWIVAFAVGGATVALASLLNVKTDAGWAAVAVFAGAATITDLLVRLGAHRTASVAVQHPSNDQTTHEAGRK
jgi:hypothetical protein